MWLRNVWQVAAFGKEIIPGQLFARKICDEDLVFFRAKDGHVVAFEDRCPHRYAPLSKGFLIGDTLRCGYHGMTYDLEGKCVYIPGQDRIPPKAKVKTYPIVERYRCVWIWMGDPEKADPARVPDVHWMDHPEWVASEGYHHVEANYKLLNDNLLDLSHETYVHGKTIGHESVAENPISIRMDEKGVYVDKEMPNCTAPPFYQYLARVSPSDPIDRWQRTVYLPPGYIVIDVGVQPVNAGPPAIRVEGRVIDLITPETATSSHYFWAFARNFRLDEPAVTEFLRENVGRTFDEDKEMLESQQRVLGKETEPAFQVAIKADAGPTQGRRLLASMIEAEATGV
jgi:phenylpropionate dioxygenase-like ring-hydroxylating dioxygenase large terminal subunit